MMSLKKILLPLALAGFAIALKTTPNVSNNFTVKTRDDQPPFLTGTQSGQGTFFDTGLGACGFINDNSEHIAAVSNFLFDAYLGYDGIDSYSNPVCGRQVTAYCVYRYSYSTTVTITDSCDGCALTDIDFTPTAFADLADLDIGRINISWEWV
ncbi:RlpA-like double-psi beta-barrel-protein domain-containing protein-containing protein [Scleroderma citrinum]